MMRELGLKSELYGSGDLGSRGGRGGGATMCVRCDDGGSNLLVCWLTFAGASSARYHDRAKHYHPLMYEVLLHVQQRMEVILQYLVYGLEITFQEE